MSLEKTIIQDKLEIIDAGGWKIIGIRTATVIRDDGEEISRNFHRHVLTPNSDITNESNEVKALAAIYFTDEAKAAELAADAGGTGEE